MIGREVSSVDQRLVIKAGVGGIREAPTPVSLFVCAGIHWSDTIQARRWRSSHNGSTLQGCGVNQSALRSEYVHATGCNREEEQPISPVKVFGAVGALACIVTSLFIQLPGLDVSGTRMFGIFLAAILLWVTEAVPLAGTAVLVIFLEVLFISDHALLSVGEGAPGVHEVLWGARQPGDHPVPGWLHGGRRRRQVQACRALSAVLLKPFMGSRA